MKLSSMLVVKDPWFQLNGGCGRRTCYPCISSKGKGLSCRSESICYQIVCKLCQKNDEKKTIYIGETSRSGYERILEHMTMFKLKKEGDPEKNQQNSVFWGHSRDSHQGTMKTYDWEIKLVSSHKSALNRQVTEATRISREKKADLFNSKQEFGSNNLAEIELKYGNKWVNSQGGSRKRKRRDEDEDEGSTNPLEPDTLIEEEIKSGDTPESPGESPHQVECQIMISVQPPTPPRPPHPPPPPPRSTPSEVFSSNLGDQQLRQELPHQLGQELPHKGIPALEVVTGGEDEVPKQQQVQNKVDVVVKSNLDVVVKSNLASLDVPALKGICASRNIKLKSNDRKSTIIVKIQQHESMKKKMRSFCQSTNQSTTDQSISQHPVSTSNRSINQHPVSTSSQSDNHPTYQPIDLSVSNANPSINQSNNKSTNQSTTIQSISQHPVPTSNQSINKHPVPTSNQSVNHPTYQSIDQSVSSANPSVNQSNNKSNNQSTINMSTHPINQSINQQNPQPIDLSTQSLNVKLMSKIKQTISQTTGQSINQSMNTSLSPPNVKLMVKQIESELTKGQVTPGKRRRNSCHDDNDDNRSNDDDHHHMPSPKIFKVSSRRRIGTPSKMIQFQVAKGSNDARKSVLPSSGGPTGEPTRDKGQPSKSIEKSTKYFPIFSKLKKSNENSIVISAHKITKLSNHSNISNSTNLETPNVLETLLPADEIDGSVHNHNFKPASIQENSNTIAQCSNSPNSGHSYEARSQLPPTLSLRHKVEGGEVH